MLLSIITINYNNLNGLKNTYLSIFEQSENKNFEWVVIDGNSSDGSIEFINTQKTNFNRFILSEIDNGIYDAMNKGVMNAKGEYLLFLNSGDTFFNSNSIATIFYELENHVNVDLFLFGFEYDRNLRYARPLFWRFWSLPTSHQSMLYNKSLLKSNLYSLEYRLAGDLDHFLRIIEKKIKVCNIKKYLIKNEPYGSNENLEELKKEYIKIYSEYIGNYSAKILMNLKFKYLKFYFKK
jgi:putative colanic acid biosynthesis glycosyltransferase